MRKVLLTLSLFIIHYSLQAQTPSNEIYLNLKKLNVLGSVLYIAAHPDDENNALLPYFAKEKMYRTAYLSLTRGDGGQNLIGSEQGIELGLIRTQELLAARKIDGSEQYFTRAYEFGYSKSWEETLKIWDHQKVLADAVWVIRNYQPDVIIARFPPDKRAGHGHHAASAIIANEAFIAAADSTKFPEQFKYGVRTWQAKRLLWNTANFGNNNTTNDSQLKIDIGLYNSLLGKSYGEIGADARTMHKSQGEGRQRRKGSITEYFAHVSGDTAKADLMDGVVTDWTKIPEGEVIQYQINKIIEGYNFEKPELSVPALVDLYKRLQGLQNKNKWVWRKIADLQQIIIDCSGLFMEAVTDNEYAVKGEKVNVNFFVNNRLGSNIKLNNIMLNTATTNSFDTAINSYLLPNINLSINKSFILSVDKNASQPYWLDAPMDNGSMFNVNDQNKIGTAESNASYMAKFDFSINNISFTYKTPLLYKYVDPVRGEVYQPTTVVTPLIVSLNPDLVLTNVFPRNAATINPMIQVHYKSNFTLLNASVNIVIEQAGDKVYNKDTILSFETGKSYSLDIPVKKIFNPKFDNNFSVSIGLKENGKTKFYSHYLRKISYDHIPNINYFYKDNVRVITDSIKVKGTKIGYIIGAGDKVPEAITAMGYEVKYLFEKDINIENLKQFDAVITGIRAYNIYEWLSSKNDALNTYVKNGGNLIVQYLKSNTVGLNKVKVGPYPFVVNAGSRVTEENAAVKFTLPNHSVLNYPNKITSQDFEGWTQERSTYQAEQLDTTHFQTPLTMNDTGEKESNGSLAIAKYGKGNFAYVSLVLFRQLPAGVPGAYKILANLIALPKNK